MILQTVTRIRNAVINGVGLQFELNRAGITAVDWDEFNGDKEGTCEAIVKKQNSKPKFGSTTARTTSK